MSEPVIQVENLGKRYRIRHQQQGGMRYKALRDVLADGTKSVARRLWSLVRNPNFSVYHGRPAVRQAPQRARRGPGPWQTTASLRLLGCGACSRGLPRPFRRGVLLIGRFQHVSFSALAAVISAFPISAFECSSLKL